MLQGSWDTVQPQPGGEDGDEKQKWGEILLEIHLLRLGKAFLSSGAQPDSLPDLFWLLWAVLNGSALPSLPRGWDVLLGEVPACLTVPSPLLPCWQKFLVLW